MYGQKFDTINQPEHYAYGSIECKDYLEAIGIAEDYYVGCIIKYLTRYKHKNGIEDLRKASRYIEYLLALKKSSTGKYEVRPDRMYSPMGDK